MDQGKSHSTKNIFLIFGKFRPFFCFDIVIRYFFSITIIIIDSTSIFDSSYIYLNSFYLLISTPSWFCSIDFKSTHPIYTHYPIYWLISTSSSFYGSNSCKFSTHPSFDGHLFHFYSRKGLKAFDSPRKYSKIY
jgi:hypothetical protein